MQTAPQDPSLLQTARPGPWLSPALLVLIVSCCAIELILIAADWGLIGSPRWRGLAYQNGAFWAGLLFNWRPNYDAQPWLMFFTYAFLHSGFGHLAGNMLTLFLLGNIAQERVGQRGLLALYAISAIGGAAVFGVLTASPQPMVGASGALFGLAGAWQYWEWSDRRRQRISRWPVWRVILGLVALNVVLWWWLDGLLAWETHLGGFVAGWAGAVGLARMGKGANPESRQ